MDFEFYNDEPSPTLGRRAVAPFRRLLRRLQRPYFFRLRDLLTFLYHKHLEHRLREDDLTAHITTLDAAARHRHNEMRGQVHQAEEAARRRADELQQKVDAMQRQLAAVAAEQARFEAFAVDYLALSRRLALLEDLLLQLQADLPVGVKAPDRPDGAIPFQLAPPQTKAS